MRSARSALLLGATALVGLGLILLLMGGTAIHGGAALGVLAAGWWGVGLIPVHARTAPEPARREAAAGPGLPRPGPPGAGDAPPGG
ncbi:hypothetical protein OU787_22980 [Kitasatospora sp. YST-16]|uniref:hypothetical protein n=1 Tax=Kitasatospora sp. YST-16 TaxID=2998080 RepID=UPI002283580A|nr:hypothetical protein [Kitasatospora sp. YST-16]WAL74109.1 hypothetical protein OU787_22980 [Kitasatospora sp. YST-16]WNW40177.1 hypothetical protein RKE32_22930 [Streptomyces sp. Li-HN-5-13]